MNSKDNICMYVYVCISIYMQTYRFIDLYMLVFVLEYEPKCVRKYFAWTASFIDRRTISFDLVKKSMKKLYIQVIKFNKKLLFQLVNPEYLFCAKEKCNFLSKSIPISGEMLFDDRKCLLDRIGLSHIGLGIDKRKFYTSANV